MKKGKKKKKKVKDLGRDNLTEDRQEAYSTEPGLGNNKVIQILNLSQLGSSECDSSMIGGVKEQDELQSRQFKSAWSVDSTNKNMAINENEHVQAINHLGNRLPQKNFFTPPANDIVIEEYKGWEKELKQADFGKKNETENHIPLRNVKFTGSAERIKLNRQGSKESLTRGVSMEKIRQIIGKGNKEQSQDSNQAADLANIQITNIVKKPT